MQAELEKWIDASRVTEATVIFGEKSQGFGDLTETMIPERLVRALLEGKVLCEKEPVGYVDSAMIGGIYWAHHCSPGGKSIMTPLYAPAFPARESDIGKEGGE